MPKHGPLLAAQTNRVTPKDDTRQEWRIRIVPKSRCRVTRSQSRSSRAKRLSCAVPRGGPERGNGMTESSHRKHGRISPGDWQQRFFGLGAVSVLVMLYCG